MEERQYNILAQAAGDIERRFRNMIDDPNHSISEQLRGQIFGLLADIQAKKHPRTIEDTIKRIQQQLIRARELDELIMRIDENIELYKHCENLRLSLRKLPNY